MNIRTNYNLETYWDESASDSADSSLLYSKMVHTTDEH